MQALSAPPLKVMSPARHVGRSCCRDPTLFWGIIGLTTIVTQKCRRNPLSQSKGFSECTLHHRKRLALRPTATADNLYLGGFGVQEYTKLYCCPPKQRQQYEANNAPHANGQDSQSREVQPQWAKCGPGQTGPNTNNQTNNPGTSEARTAGAVQAFPGIPK